MLDSFAHVRNNLLVLLPILGLLLVVGSISVVRAAPSTTILITGVYYDPFVSGEASEAIQLQNVTVAPISIGNWQVSDGEGTVSFPNDAALNGYEKIWLSKSAVAFKSEFGFLPAYEYGGDSDPGVPDMTGTAPSLTNTGDQVYLKNDGGIVIDAMVYGNATLNPPDWSGDAVQPYEFGSASKEGQILFRKQQESDGLPVADTDTRADWAQDTADNVLGKRVAYPGWDNDQFFQTVKANENATIQYCVAPDQLFECASREIVNATSTISMEVYALDNANVVDVVTRTLDAGVHLSIGLDASALGDQGKWGCYKIEAHGGQCWLLASKPQSNIHKRYDSQHGKWLVIDHARALIGSENLGDDAMPADDKRNGTFGTRGGFLITDNHTIVSAVQKILEHDFNPALYADVRRWGTNTDDFPPFDFVPNYADGGSFYKIQFPDPFQATGAFPIELVQCPDNCMRSSDALLGLVASAGAGDDVLVEQLYEYPYWGVGTSNATADPNPRLEGYIAAAKRGARVRILLDSFYDVFSDPRSNYQTCANVNQFQNQYDIECRMGNPTGRGIHMKMLLLKHGADGFVHLGSINGSETSNKLNRELATQVESLAAFRYWKKVFDYDWSATDFAPHRTFLPLLERQAK